MKNFVWHKLSVLAFLCIMMPMVGMDALKDLRAAADLLIKQNVEHMDLFQAASILPVEYDQNHLCIKVLCDAHFNFIGEKNRIDQRYAKNAKELAQEGERAMAGAKYLIIDLIRQRKEDKNKYKKEKQQELEHKKNLNAIHQAEIINKLTTYEEKVIAMLDDLQDEGQIEHKSQEKLSRVQNAISKKNQKIFELQQHRDQILILLNNTNMQVTNVTQEKNIFEGAFLACALSFFAYVLYVKYA